MDVWSERAALQIDVVLTWNELPEGRKLYSVLGYDKRSSMRWMLWACVSSLCVRVNVGTCIVCEWAVWRVSGVLTWSSFVAVSDCSTAAFLTNSREEKVRERFRKRTKNILTLPTLHLGLFLTPSSSNLSPRLPVSLLSVGLGITLSWKHTLPLLLLPNF